ncbi:hypothetical protein K505DRAFT_152898 [Melanomma pulvis-pyrius CBS 109.77]|uniref:Uncharacterized protein n=1 Tax=Melanomma pulvis-pyrius CBS 109.77 TaxID=1314802 RepID=A0A6A6XKI0_9PLEO|nr:hypothetical protein K505DRAFT_152898 [Melanomma pulvis-pyrius CBS 109.77]
MASSVIVFSVAGSHVVQVPMVRLRGHYRGPGSPVVHASHPCKCSIRERSPPQWAFRRGFWMTWSLGPCPCLPRGYVSARVTGRKKSPATRSQRGGYKPRSLGHSASAEPGM